MSSQQDDGMEILLFALVIGGIVLVVVGGTGEFIAGLIGSTCPTGNYLDGAGPGEGWPRVLDGYLGAFHLLILFGGLGIILVYVVSNRVQSTSTRRRYPNRNPLQKWYTVFIGVGLLGIVLTGGFHFFEFGQADCIAGLGRYIPDVF